MSVTPTSMAEQLLDAAPDAVVIVNAAGTLVLVNRQVEVMFGYARDELVGHPFDLLVPDRVKQVHPAHRDSYFANPRVRPMGAGMDLTARRKDGSEFPVDIALSSLETSDGRLVYAAVRDISDRRKVEKKFEGLLEAAPSAILGVDRDGRIRLANQQVETLFGYGREELVGQPVEMLVPERVRDAHPGHRQRYFDDPQRRPMGAGIALTALRKDGTEFPADIALSAIESEDGLLVIAAVSDVSDQWAWAERERLQAQLNQSQRLESVGQLAGGIAHDFNNLLAVILNYADFVGEALKSDAPIDPAGAVAERDELLQDVEQIRRAAQRAAVLTHQLLIFSRREVVKPEVFDLNGVVQDLDKLLRRSIGEHIALRVRLAEDLWRITADPSQLEQVLVNLAVNARDAMPDGGTLTIETANVELDDTVVGLRPVAHPGRYVRLTVSDTGVGMTPDVVDRAFEPFFTTKPRGQGSGLGLATVYGIVTQAGGHVDLYTELGIGTTFRLYLPATAAATLPAAPAAGMSRKGGGGRTVLLVEDEEAVREITSRILRRDGYRVLLAESGTEALGLAVDPDVTVDLLLTDVVMPGLSGRELADRIAEVRPGVPVVFMSGYSGDFLADRVGDPGVHLVEKPFTASTLLATIEGVLDDVR